MTTKLPNTTEAPRRDGSPLTEGLGLAPERADFAAWWRESWPEATPQSASFAEAERCARLAWDSAVASERERWVAACRSVMNEHGGDPAGQLVDYANRDRLVSQCQAAGASQVLARGLGPNGGVEPHAEAAGRSVSARTTG